MSVSNLGDLVATAQLDISPFKTSTAQLKILLRGIDSQLKTVENSFKGQKDKLTSLKASHSLLGKTLEANQALYKVQVNTYRDLESEIKDVNTATKEQKIKLLGSKAAMEATASKVAELQSKYNALTREIAIQSSVFTQIGDVLQPAGKKLKTFGDSLHGVGQSLTMGVTLPMITGVGYVTNAAIKYESAFAGVKKTVDETATTSYRKLSDSIRQMSMQLPASAAEIAKVAEVAGQLGIKADDITDFTKVMIDLGESTNMNATTAAESLAKFANITNLLPENYSRLGSSIVHLGNNFATTEADITDMAMRLAGAGSQIGLSQADILGLSAALSSVGIEAEMGGSAFSKVMVKMQLATTVGSNGMAELSEKTGLSRREFELLLANSPKDFKELADSIGMTSTEMSNIVKASANLEDFARISGMSVDEFTHKFEKDAVGAIGAFINGLGNADKQGTSAIEMLTEMGFTEVRLRDALLRAGNAQDLFANATKTSNEAWNENKALTEEANKRYETTESKLKMLKNKVDDVAIEFGGAFVDALSDGFDAMEPIIESAADMAKAFSELDEEQQQQIIQWGLMLAAVGPTMSVLGKGIGVIGSVSQGLGVASKFIGTATGELGFLASGAGDATAAAGGLSGAVGLLGNPVTWGILLGGAAVVGLAWWANEFEQAEERTRMWGTEVDKVQAGELSRFKDKVDDTKKAMSDFATGATEEVEGIKEAFAGLTDEIIKLTDKELAKDLKIADQMGWSDVVKDALKKNAQEGKDAAQKLSDEVIAIYSRHKNKATQLSEDEKTIVLNAQSELIERRLELEGYSSKEILAIREAMNGDISKMNKEQAYDFTRTTLEWISEEEKSYKTRHKNITEALKELGAEDVEARKELHGELQTLEAEHAAKMDGYRENGLKAVKKWYDEVMAADKNGEKRIAIHAELKGYLAQMGITYDEFVQRMALAEEKAAETSGILAKDIEGMSSNMKKANDDWRSLVWDEKEMKMKTNARDILKEAINSKDGWERMKFIIKNANLTTNAKSTIALALMELGKWDSLDPEIKKLLTSDQTAPGVQSASATMSTLSDKTVTINAYDNTDHVIAAISSKISSFASQAFNLVINATPHVKGTNFHPGGLAMVNDQKGSLYKEMVTLPTGESFIPEGRNVVLPLPRGSKVLKASDTKKLFPHYASGIGFEDTNISVLANKLGRTTNADMRNSSVEEALRNLLEILAKGEIKELQTQQMIDELLKNLSRKSDEVPVVMNVLDGEVITKVVTRNQEKNKKIAAIMEGVFI